MTKAGGIFGQNQVGEYFRQPLSGPPFYQAAAGEYFRQPLSGCGCASGLGATGAGTALAVGTVGTLVAVSVVGGLLAIGLFYLSNIGDEKPVGGYYLPPVSPPPQRLPHFDNSYAPTRVMARNKRRRGAKRR